MEKALLVDTSNMVYRMFSRAEKNGFNPLSCFKTEVFRILDMHDAYRHIFAIDCKRGKTWRNKLYENYKANRQSPSSELSYYREKMVEWVKNEFEYYEKDEEEADDIIGTITNHVDSSLIVSNDGDYQQLLSNKVNILCPNRSGFYDYISETDFKKKNNLNPIQLIDLKALMGDTSDNYKGCPRVGEKMASILVAKYNTIEEIYEKIDEIVEVKDKIKQALKDNKDYVLLCKVLATIKQDIDLVLADSKKKYTKTVSDCPINLQQDTYDNLSEVTESSTCDLVELPF